jgi:hypothetical protein
LDLLSIGDVDKMKVDVFGQAGRQIGARASAYVQDSDLLRVLAALQQMADDPATEKTGLSSKLVNGSFLSQGKARLAITTTSKTRRNTTSFITRR